MSLHSVVNSFTRIAFAAMLTGLLRRFGFAILLVTPCAVIAAPTVALQEVASGFSSPVELVNSGDGSGRLFVVEQGGRIKILPEGSSAALATPFLDISTLISAGGERGLLGLAFHPQYASNGAFFVYYTKAGSGSLVISRFLRSTGNPLIADPASEAVLLDIPHPVNANHNGGHLAFGPDGYLYIGTGDGGGGGDPDLNGQRLSTRLGKMLRIGVSAGTNYTIPPTNPFASSSCTTACPEIWAYGLRNPWKFSFDRATGALFIGDVGQGALEEIDRVPAGVAAPVNFGWNVFEGTSCYNPSAGCTIDSSLAPHTQPIIEYGHNSTGGFSVTGGYMYRGARSPSLRGYYFYGDFVSKRIWVTRSGSGGAWTPEFLSLSPAGISSFGEDENGELYVVGYDTGKIYALEGLSASPNLFTADFSGDGKSDLVFRNTTTGQVSSWIMDGISATATGGLVAPGNWTISHTADFNGDRKADILFRNGDGSVTLWLMNGLSVTASVGLLGPDPGWRVSHVADFNGDGKADILWRNINGSVTLWLMNGTAVASSVGLLGSDPSWNVTHVGDFNGDGNADILWSNTNGSVVQWLMSGTTITSNIGLLGPDPEWRVTHLGDFNNDGKADILWRNANGSVALWLMNGTAVASTAGLLAADPNWRITHVGDFNGDGKSDILWRNNNGSVTQWLMFGTSVANATSLLGPDPNWRVTHLGDFNGDGKGDIVWRNSSNGAITMWLMNGATTISAAGILGSGPWGVVPK
jgi:glucose/arabinose dehydrogenase